MELRKAQQWTTFRPLMPEDIGFMAKLRATVAPLKGQMRGIEARPQFDAIMSRVPAPEGIAFEPDTVGGIAGCWCLPLGAPPDAAILHLHGGWYNWGTATSFRHFVGMLAKRAGAKAFIPDYRLAPENPFPAAILDTHSAYRGLLNSGIHKVAITGDSAGGGLALSLLSWAVAEATKGLSLPVGAVVLSPVTDLTQSSASWKTRAEVDPYFTTDQAAGLIGSYLGNADAIDPFASPLYADLGGLPPIRMHVGEDEVLLNDSTRYVQRAVSAGVDARLDVWEGMVHGFVSDAPLLRAATLAVEAIGSFLEDRLSAESSR